MIPKPAVERLCRVYHVLTKLLEEEAVEISSAEIGKRMGIKPHTVRKDISYLDGETGSPGGYDVKALSGRIRDVLGFDERTRGCIVGLGRLGSALLAYMEEKHEGFEIAAGFDSSVNRLELLKTRVPLYPAHEISERVRKKKIRVAVLTVPADAAQLTAERLTEGGVRGIINFAPVGLHGLEGVVVRNVYLLDEIRIVSALIQSAEYFNKEIKYGTSI
ncbi:MAG: redox-sensing transcriptional repressor Rex [Spirochaetia bacterium]